MANKEMEVMGIVMVIIATVSLWTGAVAQSSCNLVSLSPCISFVTGTSLWPSESCCTQLSSMVNSQMGCLCMVLNGGGVSALGFPINQTHAISLPGACSIQAPPISQCNTVGAKATAPDESALAPVSPSATLAPTDNATQSSTPSVPPLPSGTKSKTVPLKHVEPSAARPNLSLVPMLLFMLLVGLCPSTLNSIH